MKPKTFPAVLLLLSFMTGCSIFSGSEPPSAAKVPSKKPLAKKPANQGVPPAPPVAKKPAPGTGTATYAIDTAPGNFKDEPSTPAFRAEPLTPQPLQPAQTPQSPAAPQAALLPPASGSGAVPEAQPPVSPQPAATPAPTAVPAVPVVPSAPAAPVPPPIAMEDAAISAATPPAVVALIGEADRDRNKGDLDAAVVVMERALRIDARNPTLTYKLAQLRLKQSKPHLAEELAGKAALLAGSDLELKRKSWLLIAEARRLQQNYQGSKEAKAKAESFFGH